MAARDEEIFTPRGDGTSSTYTIPLSTTGEDNKAAIFQVVNEKGTALFKVDSVNGWITAPGVEAVELGTAKDTSISRTSAGRIAVEGEAVLQQGYTTTATAAGTTTLTVASTWAQFFTGATTQTVVMPVVSTLVLGQTFLVVNKSSDVVTVQSSGGNAILAQAAGTAALYTCILITGTTAASWNAEYVGFDAKTGTGSVVLATSPTLVTPALGIPASGTLTNCGGLPNTGVNNPMIRVLTETHTAASFTDGGATIGTKTFTSSIPAASILIGSKVIITAGFAGDVSAVMTIGDGTDADRYMTGTMDVFAAAATGVQSGVPSGDKLVTVANQPVLTVTSSSDFTLCAAGGGSATVSIYYIDTN